ncbi:acyltransferase [Arenimonas caeni]|uniref:Acetyltransferase n=1 Tax=Arenimonas caeni TaxID=2058085 RepID=A0A2P6MBX9_9GAMM|nr:hypothetical protein C6N40_02265 [Arenimonas caeni]
MNHELGLSNLRIGQGVYIGPDVLLDLAGPLLIGDRSTISARCVLLTHHDPGASQGNSLAQHFPPSAGGCEVGMDCWIGAGAILLEGAELGAQSVVGAGALVRSKLPGGFVYAGSPARAIRRVGAKQVREP